jgi:beta-glucanase (GH16 family)
MPNEPRSRERRHAAAHRRRRLRTFLAVVVLLLGAAAFAGGSQRSAAHAATTSGTCTTAVSCGDDFTGAAGAAPDPTKWIHEMGGGGWGNSELECYTDSLANAHLDGLGDLLIIAKNQPNYRCADGNVNNYTSARLNSRWQFQYGSVEMRAKMPTGHGIWPAFWAMGNNFPTVNWPKAGEMDFTEVVGKQPTIDHVALHGPRGGGRGDYDINAQFDAAVDLSQAFHLYGATWTTNSISFYFDHVLVRTFTPSDVPAAGKWVFDHPFYALLNVAVGGRWPGSPDSTTFANGDQLMTIDYVHWSA